MDSADFVDALAVHAADNGTSAAYPTLRTAPSLRSAAKATSAFCAGLRAAKIMLADALMVGRLSRRALAKRLGMSPSLIDRWLDVDRPERPPLGALLALTPTAISAAASLLLDEVRTVTAPPTRTLEGQLLWMQERAACIACAVREERWHDAIRAQGAMRDDVRELGVLLAGKLPR